MAAVAKGQSHRGRMEYVRKKLLYNRNWEQHRERIEEMNKQYANWDSDDLSDQW